jgi:hypothetical protein
MSSFRDRSEQLALGVDLAYLTVGMALVSKKFVVELTECVIPRGKSLIEGHHRLMEHFEEHRHVIEQAAVVFIEVPTSGFLSKLFHGKKTSVPTIEHLAMSLLSFEIALERFEIEAEVHYVDPAKVIGACRNLPPNPIFQNAVNSLGFKGPKYSRRLWLHHIIKGTNWIDPLISDHQSDAAFTAFVCLQVWKLGGIDSYLSRHR